MSTEPTEEPIDGGLDIDPAIARVLLIFFEDVAQATFLTVQSLRALGVDDPEVYVTGPRSQWPATRTAGR